jgi:hypothetical protein
VNSVMTNTDEYELIFRTADRQLVRGWYRLHDNMITVRREDGRTKTTQIGGSAWTEEALARIMLGEPEGWS